MVELRDYQMKYVSELTRIFSCGHKRVVLCSPTGSGKTVMFSWMAYNSYLKNKRILIITDRKELFSQSGSALTRMDLKPKFISPEYKCDLNGNLHVAMMQTISRRMKKQKYLNYLKALDFVIIDEAHKQAFNPIFETISESCFVIGATATPHREGNQETLEKHYTEIVQVIDTPQLIEKGFLSSCKTYGVKVDLSGIKTKAGDYDEKSMGNKFSEIKLFHGVYQNYKRICNGKKALIFAPNVDSSKELVENWCYEGLDAKHVDCYMSMTERNEVLDWFYNTDGAILSNYGILTTGYDCPSIEVVILYRATKSLPLFLQMVGRGSRITQRKKSFVLLDFGNNIRTHGYWEDSRMWTLKKKEKKQGEMPIKECPDCAFIVHARAPECPECGHEFEKSEKEKEEQFEAELVLMRGDTLNTIVEKANFDELLTIKTIKGYADNWIYYHLKTAEDFRKYGKWKGYHYKWAIRQIKIKGL